MSTSQNCSSLSTQNYIIHMALSSDIGLTDLLSDPDFRNWVKTGSYKKSGNYWSDWRVENPQHEETVKQAIAILLASHVDEAIDENEVDEIVSGVWERIENQQKTVRPLLRWWWVAASTAVLAAFLYLYNNQNRTLSEQRTNAATQLASDVEQTNSSEKPMLIMLSDGSSVILMPGSKLQYAHVFRPDIREVHLIGEAFFEISKNPGRPFFVHTKTITTRVVGTSFSVRAFDEESDVNVLVKTGKVSVYRAAKGIKTVPKDAVVLVANQNVRYNKEHYLMNQPVTSNAYASLKLKNTSFEFSDTPVTVILDSIAAAYGLKMEYNGANLEKCILTTSLNDSPLQGKLNIICKALGQNASYKIEDDRIKISAQGCN